METFIFIIFVITALLIYTQLPIIALLMQWVMIVLLSHLKEMSKSKYTKISLIVLLSIFLLILSFNFVPANYKKIMFQSPLPLTSIFSQASDENRIILSRKLFVFHCRMVIDKGLKNQYLSVAPHQFLIARQLDIDKNGNNREEIKFKKEPAGISTEDYLYDCTQNSTNIPSKSNFRISESLDFHRREINIF